MLIPLKKNENLVTPKVEDIHFIAPTAYLIGNVKVGKEVSIFFGAVLRGDINPIIIGNRTNIQEHALLHTTKGRSPCVVGDGVTVGHRAIIHGAEVKNNCLIGMGAIILDDSLIEENSLVGAGSLVTEGKKFPPNSLIIGSPAKVVRELSKEEVESIKNAANSYIYHGSQLASQFQST